MRQTDRRDKKQAEVLGSALKTRIRKPAKRAGAGKTDGHNETYKYAEFNDLIGKTRLASACDDSEWLFDLTKEYKDKMIEKAKDVKRLIKRTDRLKTKLERVKEESDSHVNYLENALIRSTKQLGVHKLKDIE